MLEMAFAVLTCIAAAAAGYPMGLRWARGRIWCLILGAMAGSACVALYFTLSLWINLFWPASIDAHRVGIVLVKLMVIAPLISVLTAWLGYRQSQGLGVFCRALCARR